MSKSLEKEKKRLARLKKTLETDQKKLDKEKSQLRKEKKELENQRKKLYNEKKMLKNKEKQMMLNVKNPKSPRRGGSSSSKDSVKLKKVQNELNDIKKKHDEKAKQNREQKKRIDELQDKLKVLERKLKNSKKSGRNNKNEDRRIRNLKQEIKVLKRKLKRLMGDLDKQRRYYLRKVKEFKEQQDRWIQKQKDLWKNKKMIVKYVFLDDIKKIKIYPKRKRQRHKVRIQTRDGDTTVVYIDSWEQFEDGDDDNDEEDDKVLEEIEKEVKIRRKRKKPRDNGEENGDEVEVFSDVDDGGDDDEDDDNKDDDEDVDYNEEQINHLLGELEHRTRDLHRVCEIYVDEPLEDQEENLKVLRKQVEERHEQLLESLTKVSFEAVDEMPDINKAWQDEIYKIKEAVDQAIVKVLEQEKQDQEEKDDQEEEPKKKSQLNPEEVEGLKQQRKSLLEANKQLIEELCGRLEDMEQLNNIYFHPDPNESEEYRKERVDGVIGTINQRQTSKQNSLKHLDLESIPEENLVEDFENNSKGWQNMIVNFVKDHDGMVDKNDVYDKELEGRTKDLEEVVNVMSGKEPPSNLDNTIENCKERQESLPNNDDSDKWRDLLKQLKDSKQITDDEIKEDQSTDDYENNDDKFKDNVIDNLLEELHKRCDDITNLNKVNPNIPEELEHIKMETENRHKEVTDSLLKSNDNKSNKKREKLLQDIQEDNKKWQQQLDGLVEDSKSKEDMKRVNDAYMDELNNRINDLLKIKSVVDDRLQLKKKSDINDIKDRISSILSDVEDRHKSDENNMKENGLPQSNLYALQENDNEWRDNVGGLLTNLTKEPLLIISEDEELEEEEEEVTNNNKNKSTNNTQQSNSGNNNNNTNSGGNEEEIKEDNDYNNNNDNDDEERLESWWLDQNEKRKNHVDSIVLPNDDDEEVLNNMSNYVCRVLNDDTRKDPTLELYVPPPESDKHHNLSILYDCGVLCQLLNKVEDNYVDTRIIHKPDPINPKPLSDKQVKENAQLLGGSIKGLGIKVDSKDIDDDWINPKTTFKVMKPIIENLHNKHLSKYVNLNDTPQLYRLKKNNEENHKLKHLHGDEWIDRWLNFSLDRPVLDSIDDYNEDIFNLLKKLYPDFSSQCENINNFSDNPTENAETILNFIVNDLKINTDIEANDLVNQNKYCQQFLAALLFNKNNNLEELTREEKREYGVEDKQRKKKVSKGDAGLLSFINSIIPGELEVTDLVRDLSDGVVLAHILDKLQPGIIKWKAIRKPIRHKFDKITNCNYDTKIIKKHFKTVNVPGLSGQDLVEGKQKTIHTMLWQLMRYHSTKLLAELSFGGKPVKDEDILQWANLTMSGLKNHVSDPIKSFRDHSLSKCIFYLELLKAILPPDSVRDKLIHYDLPILRPRSEDTHKQQRLENARYAMTLVRMNGGELFILAEDLMSLETKAVLSMMACVMTIALTKNKDKKNRKQDFQIDKLLSGEKGFTG